jgi:hypothetical protein
MPWQPRLGKGIQAPGIQVLTNEHLFRPMNITGLLGKWILPVERPDSVVIMMPDPSR